MQKTIKERKLSLLVFIISISLLIAVAVLNYINTLRFINVSDRARIANTEIMEMDALFFVLVTLESRQRGFIITGKEYSLSMYQKRRDSVFYKLALVKKLFIDKPETAAILSVMDSLINLRIASLDNAIRVRKEQGFPEAAKLIETDVDINIKNGIRAAITKIQEIGKNQYSLIEAKAKESAQWTIVNTIVGYSLTIILLVGIFITLIKEIGARIRSEAEAYEYAKQINDLYNNAPVGYCSLNSEGKFISVNNTQLRWLGYRRDDLITNKKFIDLLDAGSAAKFNDHFASLKQGKDVADVELNIIKVDGYIFPVLWNSTSVKNTKGEFLRSRSVLFDNTKLSRNRQNLEAVNNELQAFAHSVSHDLRAPLRHINGFIDLLLQKAGEKLDEQSGRYLQIIREASHKMGVLIDELLAFSRMSRQEFMKTKVDLNKILAESIQTLTEYNNNRNIEWIISELPPVECDPAMIKIVFNNLLSNAIKFTGKKEHSKIDIGCINKPDQIVLYVKDNGAGFDMQYSSNLFGVFQRLHRQDEFEGNGIGLATVRRIINRHGGAIWAESEVGKGASFYFSLPIL